MFIIDLFLHLQLSSHLSHHVIQSCFVASVEGLIGVYLTGFSLNGQTRATWTKCRSASQENMSLSENIKNQRPQGDFSRGLSIGSSQKKRQCVQEMYLWLENVGECMPPFSENSSHVTSSHLPHTTVIHY